MPNTEFKQVKYQILIRLAPMQTTTRSTVVLIHSRMWKMARSSRGLSNTADTSSIDFWPSQAQF